jgi:membrane fusion protein (multidrug efflux system)
MALFKFMILTPLAAMLTVPILWYHAGRQRRPAAPDESCNKENKRYLEAVNFMKSKIVIAIFIVLAVVGGLVGVKTMQIKAMAAATKSFLPPPLTVSSAIAQEEEWQDTIRAVGSISSVQGVVVAPELAGTVREIAFESGQVVAKGDLLVRLDVSAEEAQLRAAQAQVEWARISAERDRTLRAQNMISQSDLDSAEATLKQNQANADAIQAVIEKKTIRAPFAGRLGVRLINLGQYLDVGKAIVSLQSLTPVNADFSLPQQELARVKTGMKVRVTSDAYPDKPFEGILTAINPDLDTATRSVGLQARIDNPDQLLRPGMYARMEVLLPESHRVLVIPATSVLSDPYGDKVYVIEPQGGTQGDKSAQIVRQQLIRTGRTRGDFVAVELGLKPGEKVVSSGIFKLRPGLPVVENNNLSPKHEKAPAPSEG